MTHAVIFDIDGTLLQSSQEDDRLYRRAAETVLGPVRFRDALADYTHVSDAGILTELLCDNGLEVDGATVAAVRQRFLAATKSYVADFGPFREVPGARHFISRLQDSERHAVAIATGGWRPTARFKLRSAGFELDGIPLKTSDDAVDRVEIMRLALRALGEDIVAVTFYGDASWDQMACERLGWSFRAVGPALRGIETFEQEQVD